MKKYLSIAGLISLLMIIGLAVTSCGGGGSPANVVKQLHTAIEKGDTKKIGELATPEAAGMIAMMGDKAKGMLASYGSITKTEEKINGDTATVTVTYRNGETGDFDLVKTDGKWKVSMNK
jgi:ketosteroid isomerase-like protein